MFLFAQKWLPLLKSQFLAGGRGSRPWLGAFCFFELLLLALLCYCCNLVEEYPERTLAFASHGYIAQELQGEQSADSHISSPDDFNADSGAVVRWALGEGRIQSFRLNDRFRLRIPQCLIFVLAIVLSAWTDGLFTAWRRLRRRISKRALPLQSVLKHALVVRAGPEHAML